MPLFVEELTKSILESGELEDAGDHYDYAGAARTITIPATLRDSLMARLDRFMPVKEIAQIGAAIGREFSYELIAAVAPTPKTELDGALDAADRIGAGVPPRHAARGAPTPSSTRWCRMRPTTRCSRADRQELHAKIARVIEERFPGIKDTEPEMLAHHYTGAGETETAIPYWSIAGQRALARTALPESVGHLSKALDLVQTLPLSSARDRDELDIRINLAIAQMAYGGWTYSAIPVTLNAAISIAERLGDTKNQLIALFYTWLYQLCLPDIEQTRAYASKLLSLAESSSDRTVSLVADYVLCMTAGAAGEWKEAKHHGDKVLARYDFDRDSSLTFLLNHDLNSLYQWAANYYWALGFPQKARETSLAYLEIARRIGHSFNLLWALTGGTQGLIHAGDAKRALEWNREARAHVKENAMAFGEQGPCNYFGGPALIADGQYAEGYEMATRGITFWNSTGGALLDPMVNNSRAYALGKLKNRRRHCPGAGDTSIHAPDQSSIMGAGDLPYSRRLARRGPSPRGRQSGRSGIRLWRSPQDLARQIGEGFRTRRRDGPVPSVEIPRQKPRSERAALSRVQMVH